MRGRSYRSISQFELFWIRKPRIYLKFLNILSTSIYTYNAGENQRLKHNYIIT